MADTMENILAFLKYISGAIGSLLVIIGFLATLLKPLRQKISNQIIKLARTPLLIDRLDSIDKNISEITNDLSSLKSQLTKHAEENSIDIKNASTAQMMALRCQIREIFSSNYEKKSLTMREQRDIFDMYSAYLALGGNGYISSMLEEMKTWKIHGGL